MFGYPEPSLGLLHEEMLRIVMDNGQYGFKLKQFTHFSLNLALFFRFSYVTYMNILSYNCFRRDFSKAISFNLLGIVI